jgi:ribosomal protein S12 methylthiotransferase accessory factor
MLRPLAPTPIDESLRRLQTLVSSHVGVVRSTRRYLAVTDDAPLVSVACELADGRDVIGADVDARAIAWSPSGRTALAAALGEAVERYSASYLPASGVALSTAAELGPEAVDPERFTLFRSDQYERPGFACRPFTRETPVRWARAARLPDGAPAWLPAQLVYLTGLPPAPGETIIGYATSSGLACGPTLEEALQSALFEVLERDAFMLTWNARLSLPRLELSGHPELERFLDHYVSGTGLRVAAVDLSVFHDVPTVLALVRGNDGVALTVGAAAAGWTLDACTKAFGEAFAGRAWARVLVAGAPEREFEPDFADVVDFDDHVHLYALSEHAHHADFLDASTERRMVSKVPELHEGTAADRVVTLADRLQRAGTPAYAVDVTSPDVRAARMRVVRVLVPELSPLDLFHGGRFLGGRRLYEAPRRLGLRDSPLEPDQVNPYPHPFP